MRTDPVFARVLRGTIWGYEVADRWYLRSHMDLFLGSGSHASFYGFNQQDHKAWEAIAEKIEYPVMGLKTKHVLLRMIRKKNDHGIFFSIRYMDNK